VPSKLTIEEMRSLASAKGGKCLSSEYSSNRVKLLWTCHKGHEWLAKPQHIKAGSWCPNCASNAPVSIEDARKAATYNNGECLSDSILTSNPILKWRCAKGHEWEGYLGKVRRGEWCPRCAGKRNTLDDMQELAALYGGKCVSQKYAPNTKLNWKCQYEHTWTAYPYVLKQGSWCPICAGRGSTIEDMQRLAHANGGWCLSTKYITCQKHLTWQCANKHIWSTAPLTIRHGAWCPECKQNKRERACRAVFETLFQTTFAKARPPWLRNSRGNMMELDGYSNSLAIAFEYQGFQHYEQCYWHSGPEDFAWQQQKDQEKRLLCKANGVTLIEVPWHTKDITAFIRGQTLGLAKAS